MRKKMLLLVAGSLFAGAFAFACGSDDANDVVDQVQTEVGDAATSIVGEVTEISGDDTPEAGGAQRTPTPDCPTVEVNGTPAAAETVPAGCDDETPEADQTEESEETETAEAE